MNAPHSAKLVAAFAECELHASVLAEATRSLPDRFEPSDVAKISVDVRRTLDQLAYRFMKLQDGLGEKVLPGVLTATLDPLPPDATFAEKLQRLERLGALASADGWRLGALAAADGWRLLREVRNSLAHEYPENPALQAAALTRLLVGVRDLLCIWGGIRVFADTRLNISGE